MVKDFLLGVDQLSFGMLGLNVDGVEQSLAYWALPWRARQRFTAPMEISSKPKSRVRGGSIIDLVLPVVDLKGKNLRLGSACALLKCEAIQVSYLTSA